MLIAGAKGHAKEILELLTGLKEPIVFYDDVSTDLSLKLYDQYTILKSFDEARQHFALSGDFILGLGKPTARRSVTEKLEKAGGRLQSIIAGNATIGRYEVAIKDGVNIMDGVMISNSVTIGRGVLINARSVVHHDCIIKEFTEIGPGCLIAGGCTIGHDCSIGAGVILIPGVTIGNNVTIGAGAVVTKNIAPHSVIAGVPARSIT